MHINLIKSVCGELWTSEIFTPLKRKSSIVSHRSENGVFSRGGEKKEYGAGFSHGLRTDELVKLGPEAEVSILTGECRLSSPGALGQMMPTCPLSWFARPTSAPLSSPSDVIRGAVEEPQVSIATSCRIEICTS